MTLVVTHANGFLGCFTREPDGSMRQRALIDTGEEPPTAVELAELGTVLANQWGWNINGHSLPEAPEPKPKRSLPQAKTAPVKQRGYRLDPHSTGERMSMIVDYLRSHPNSTQREVISGLGFDAEDKQLMGRWTHQFKELIRQRVIMIAGIRNNGTSGHPNEYILPTVASVIGPVAEGET